MERKTYWRSLEEKAQPEIENWKTPEFEYTLKEMMEIAKSKKLSRKDFMKFLGASAVMVTAACRRPTEQIIPAVIQSPEYTPGEKVYYASATPEGTGIIIHTREGRPIKIAGNPDHPLTKGGVSGREVADIMDLYDPDRLRYAVRIENKRKSKTSKEEIISEIQTKIESENYVLITGPIQSPTSKKLINEFIKQFPNGKHYEFRPDPTLRTIAEGQKLSYGTSVVPYFRFDKAKLVVAIENDFMGTFPGAQVYSRAFTEKRNLNYKKQQDYNSLIVFESMFTTTGGYADHRFPIKPGDAYLIALSIAAELNNQLMVGPFAKNDQVRSLLQNYIPEKIEGMVGVSSSILKKVATKLSENKGSSIVIAGSPLAEDQNALNLQIAVNFINHILGNDGKTIDYQNPMTISPGSSIKEILQVIEDIRNQKIKVVLLANANLVYHLPPSIKVEEALKNADFVVSFSDRIDETGWASDAVLPLSHYMESWSDVELVSGIRSVIQPVIRPLYDTLSFEDYLIQILGPRISEYSFHEYLKNEWAKLTKESFTKFWIGILQSGYYQTKKLDVPGKERRFELSSLDRLPKEPKNTTGYRIGLFYHISLYDGTGANNAYRQEQPDPITKVVWSNYVAVLPETARKLKLKQGSIVEIKTEEGTLKLPVYLQPGLHPEAMLIPLGYGRTSAGKVGNNVGENAIKITSIKEGQWILTGISPLPNGESPVSLTGERVKLAVTQMVYRTGRNTENRAFFSPGTLPNAPYEASSQYDRNLVIETTYAEYKNGWKAPKQAIEFPENASLMPEWKYEGTRWYMVVDLNLCIGCGACITSCNLENNIPMVGPKEVHTGREMHWMRIDRYYSGDESNPEVVHQPMLCQQCGNAPCENVCPVAATSHSDDGINVMVYNRCIGTRYCANNCPYKVRRFNWFENWDYMEGAIRKLQDPQQLALNPDVTVRKRGIMEKCNFCLQRLNRARQDARLKGLDRIPDGSVKTACQEVCPTNAIYFGDINDPNSEVSQLVKKGRGYKVLEFLGVDPSITYLAKVRNPIL
ncbi:MAG: TAT-variant-translocated molybdopterin oxidoreductase [Leptospiraceae bacterium]|nr:TAT-variant-translocated molybdopterin oxidoreductase [Leptospiraceae bacterium]